MNTIAYTEIKKSLPYQTDTALKKLNAVLEKYSAGYDHIDSELMDIVNYHHAYYDHFQESSGIDQAPIYNEIFELIEEKSGRPASWRSL